MKIMIRSFSDDLYMMHILRPSHELEIFLLFYQCCISLHLFNPDVLNLEVAVAFSIRILVGTLFQDGIYLNPHCFASW